MKPVHSFWLRILVIVISCGVATKSQAQRHIKGQVGLTPFLGIVDRFPQKIALKQNQQGFMTGLDYVSYTKNGSYWKAGYYYDQKYYAGPTNSAPDGFYQSARHVISIDYVPRFLHTRNRGIYISPTIGVNLGYEIINNNRYNVPEGRIRTSSGGLMGIQAGFESEVYLSEKTALVLSIQERYLPLSYLNTFHTYGMVGLRFTFFKE